MKVNENNKEHTNRKHLKVITAEDVCSDKAFGYFKRGVFYPGVRNIGDVIDLNTGKIIGKQSVKRKTKRRK